MGQIKQTIKAGISTPKIKLPEIQEANRKADRYYCSYDNKGILAMLGWKNK